VGDESLDRPRRGGETHAHNVSSGPSEDCGCSAGEVGEVEGEKELANIGDVIASPQLLAMSFDP